MPSTFGMVKTDKGHYVALIPLNAEHSGKVIEIHITERESGYRSEVRYIRLTCAAQYGFQILEENAFHLVFSLIMIICAVALLGIWFVIAGKNAVLPSENYHSILWIILFSASVGVWFFTEAYVWAISTGSFAASGILNYLALSLMPLSLLGILQSICAENSWTNAFTDLDKNKDGVVIIYTIDEVNVPVGYEKSIGSAVETNNGIEISITNTLKEETPPDDNDDGENPKDETESSDQSESNVPNTGDNGNPFMWFTMLFVNIFGIAVLKKKIFSIQ